jgi:hypothetical protein
MHPARWSNRLGIIMTYERCTERRAIAGWSDLLPAAPPGAEPDRKQKAAGASGELEHGQFRQPAACARNRPIHSRQDPADAEVLWRVQNVDDLLAIKGTGQKRLDKMPEYLTVGKTQPTKADPQGR